MIPLKDSTRSRHFPIVNLTIIALNAIVWVHELSLSNSALAAFFNNFGVVPARFLDHGALSFLPAAGVSLISAAFIHGGWLHILGNMLYLWVFGDNVEDRLGHGRYLVFYLLSAAISNFTHVIVNSGSSIPTVGASGAIAAVLGAYFLMFPGARVLALVPLGFVFVTEVPALLFLLLWFALQLLNGVAVLGVPTGATGDVAYWAHIGGFVAGMALSILMSPRKQVGDLY